MFELESEILTMLFHILSTALLFSKLYVVEVFATILCKNAQNSGILKIFVFDIWENTNPYSGIVLRQLKQSQNTRHRQEVNDAFYRPI
jgi:hypothetical protein